VSTVSAGSVIAENATLLCGRTRTLSVKCRGSVRGHKPLIGTHPSTHAAACWPTAGRFFVASVEEMPRLAVDEAVDAVPDDVVHLLPHFLPLRLLDVRHLQTQDFVFRMDAAVKGSGYTAPVTAHSQHGDASWTSQYCQGSTQCRLSSTNSSLSLCTAGFHVALLAVVLFAGVTAMAAP